MTRHRRSKSKQVALVRPKAKPVKRKAEPIRTYRTVGDLKQVLRRMRDDAVLYVTLGGPHVTVAQIVFYESGHNNEPNLIMFGNLAELPYTPDPYERLLQFVGKACLDAASPKAAEYFRLLNLPTARPPGSGDSGARSEKARGHGR